MDKSKIILTALLAVACLLSGILLITTPTASKVIISDLEDFDERLHIAIEEAGLQVSEFRKSQLEIDSDFTRDIYRIEVPASYSKTSFHLALHHQLQPFNIESPAKFTFPEENMDIHILFNDTVFRTIRLITSKEADLPRENG